MYVNATKSQLLRNQIIFANALVVPGQNIFFAILASSVVQLTGVERKKVPNNRTNSQVP